MGSFTYSFWIEQMHVSALKVVLTMLMYCEMREKVSATRDGTLSNELP